jgi:hypothetical protein
MESKSKNNFYSLLSGQKSSEVILCSNFENDFFDVFAGKIRYKEPLKTNVKLGSKLYDILSFDDGVNIAMSEKLYRLLNKNDITGWKSYPIFIKNVTSKYYGLQIVGKSGKLKEPKEQGFYKGYRFETNTWDDSDFFSPDGTHLRFLSQRLRDLLIENQVY